MAKNLGKPYKPHADVARMLDRAFELVDSVPYQVSSRWVFYQLLQEGYFSDKSDYNSKLLPALSAARKRCYKQWRPDTLADETRDTIVRGDGFRGPREWFEALARAKCNLDKRMGQDYYVELWYEARAMSQQFEHYTRHITLRPMGGQPSIRYKYDAAKSMEDSSYEYELPVVVLYFGDLDKAGQVIAQTIEEETRYWCGVGFEFIRCGLTLDQVRKYGVPENPEKPGQYQWEALPDEGAREIIQGCVGQCFRHDLISTIEKREQALEQWLSSRLEDLASEWEEEDGEES